MSYPLLLDEMLSGNIADQHSEIAEQELDSACKQFKAQRGEVIVLDPKTGDVMALANWPFHPWASHTSPESSTSSKFEEL